MTRRLCLILMFFVAAVAMAFAQEMIGAIDRKIIPPSPSSAVFKKYMGEQPAMATGSVNVTIPLYKLECHNFSIPFSLRYNTNGIKVFDDPNPCGFGWAMLPGMRIMRSIMGRPDEIFEFVGDEQNLGNDFTRVQRCMTSYQVGTPNPERYDSQHDIFTVSLIDRNLTYIIDKSSGQMRFVGVGSAEYKVEADTSLSFITVIDPMGIRFLFGGAYEVIENNGTSYKSAWMLTAIELPNGERITLDWISGYHTHPRQRVLGGQHFCDNFTGHEPVDEIAGNVVSSLDRVDVSPYYRHQHLSKVAFPGGVIDFSYLYNGSGPAINRMAVFNGTDTIKTVRFEYGEDRPESYLLRKVQFSDEGDYSFEYNPGRFRFQYALDWWGFCNSNSATSLVPEMRIKFYDPPGAEGTYTLIGEADRSVDPEMMMANILTSVTYPTGGSTLFEYEPHRFKDPNVTYSQHIDPDYNKPLTFGGGLRVTKITTRNSEDDPSPKVKRYTYGEREDGLAVCLSTPIAQTFVSEFNSVRLNKSDGAVYPKPEYRFRQVNAGICSNYMDYDIGQTPIWYRQVTEYAAEGKTVYRFRDMMPDNLFYKSDGKHIPVQINKAFSKGPVKISETIYRSNSDGGYSPVRRDSMFHSVIYANIPGVCMNTHIHRNTQQLYLDYGDPHSPDFDEDGKAYALVTRAAGYGSVDCIQVVYADKADTYSLSIYELAIQTERLSGHTTTIYTDNGELSSTTSLTYLYDTGIICSKTDDTGTLDIYYPHTIGCNDDLTDDSISQAPVLGQMVVRNIISAPVYTSLTYNGDSVSARNLFARYGDSLYLPYRVMTRRGNGMTITAGTYDYDTLGNMTRRTAADGVMTEMFAWGYSGQYPVESTTGSGHVSTFSYKPLVGMTTTTDHRGMTTEYSYDNTNKLCAVGIRGLGTLERFAYHRHDQTPNAEEMTPWEGNYAVARTMLNATGTEYSGKVIHYNPLGRPVQTIDIAAGGSGGDIAVTTWYDNMGRPCRSWCPTPVSGGGARVDDSVIASAAVSFYDDACPFALTRYEASPKNREVSTTGAGEAWHSDDKSVAISRFVNDNSLKYSCRNYRITQDGVLSLTGDYAPGELIVTEITDEDGHSLIKFTDRRGLRVLERRMTDASTTADCYYIYDNYGDLRYVLPPELSARLSQSGLVWTDDHDDMKRYAFCYRYNDAGLRSDSRMPGAEWTEYLYDRGLRLVAEQNGNMRRDMQWLIRFYDQDGREVLSGLVYGQRWELEPLLENVVVARRNSSSEYFGYRFSHPLPLEISTPLRVDYYDDYSFIPYTRETQPGEFECRSMTTGGLALTLGLPVDTIPFTEFTPVPTGLSTGSLTFNLPEGTPMLRVMYYDRWGRLRESHARNHLGGMEHRYMTLSFSGKPLSIIHVHTGNGRDSVMTVTEHTYDHANRPESMTHSLNGRTPMKIRRHWYDAAGRLSSIAMAGIKVTYSLDARSWIRSIDSPQFHQELRYDDGAVPCFNGDVASMLWYDNNGSARRYDYSYDGMDRLISAAYSESRTSLPAGVTAQGAPDYSATFTYDLNSNPTRVIRKGLVVKATTGTGTLWAFGTVDDLWIELNGNRPEFVDDTAQPVVYEDAPGYHESSFETDEFDWDANGNMTVNRNKGISDIVYNVLNLPTRIEFDDGHRELRYYASDGTRLRTIYQTAVTAVSSSATAYTSYRTTSVRDYCADVIYLNDSLERVMIPSGYITPQGDYRFHILDHQGNVRVTADASGNVLERNDYYPYGGLFGETGDVQPLKYSRKELERENGLNLYDFHARLFDYAIPAFSSQDMIQEKYQWISPYTYCAANPIRFVDPSGMRIEYAEDMTPEQKGDLEYIIKELLNSNLFKTVFQTIESSNNVITIKIGETVKDHNGDNVPGQFEPNDNKNTGGTITYSDKHQLSYATTAEELYHAYQNITPNVQDNTTNFELEAKVFTIGTSLFGGSSKPLETITDNAIRGIYGSENNAYTKSRLELLKKDYLEVGQDFVQYHKQNGSNSHYTKAVLFMPQRLINLITKIE